MVNLQDAGLTENESKVYESLVANGQMLAGKLSRMTGLHRRAIYDVTDTLIKKGLIGYSLTNNRRVFIAHDPSTILTLLEDKSRSLIPLVTDLQAKFGAHKDIEQTMIFTGRTALKGIFEKQLEYPEILILGASPKAYETIPYFFKWYNERRTKKKVKLRILTADKKIRPKGLTHVRYLSTELATPVSLNIYGSSVAIIVWSKEPLAIVIANKTIADSYRQYFEVMWNGAKD